MAILVGIIENNITYSDGYGLNDSQIKNLTIIKEGTTEELVLYVKEKREDAKNAQLEFDILVQTHYQCVDEGAKALKEYNKKCEIIRQKLDFNKYKNIMILNGIIV